MNVIIRAPLLSISGYGVHSRQIFTWLEKRKDINLSSQIVQWGNTSWLINGDYEDGLIGRIIQSSKDAGPNQDVSIQVQLPDEWDPTLANKNIGVSAFVETDFCNPEWLKAVDRMDAVVVPSTFIKDSILKTGNVSTEIFVIPEWYHVDIDKNNFEDIDLNIDTKFNFLTIAQFTGNTPDNDRKNLYYTLKWFCDTFSNDKDVGLILKTNHGKGTRIDRKLTHNKIRQVISEVRKGDYPKVHLVHGNLSVPELCGLYKKDTVKCFLSLTRGEGFGLPILEAAASGIPVMTTNWSAHLDFLKLGKFIPINYSLQTIPESRIDNRIFLQNMKWAMPSEEDFKKKISKFRNKSEIPQKWAKELEKNIKSNFSSESIMPMYDSLLESVTGS